MRMRKMIGLKRGAMRSIVHLLVLTSVSLPLSSQGAAWPQWCGPNRNWTTSESAGTWPPAKDWEIAIGNSDSSPIIVNGKIYVMELVGTTKTRVKCLNAADGSVAWTATGPGGRYGRYAVGDQPTYSGPLSTPACDGVNLFSLSVDGDLQCLDALTGTTNWSFNLYDTYHMGQRPATASQPLRDYGYTTSPMLYGTNVLVEVGGDSGLVMAFNKANGSVSGAWGTGYAGHTSGPAGPEGRVHLALTHLWIDGVQIPWETEFGCNIATPAVAGSYVIATSGYNISATKCYLNGAEQWSSGYSEITHSPVVHVSRGNVYLPGTSKCIRLSDGGYRWGFAPSTSVIVTADDKVIVFGSTIRLYDSDGNKLSTITDVPGDDFSSGAFGEGNLVFRDRNSLACYTVGVADTTPPSQPTNLSATAVSESRIDLAWSPAADVESGISHYSVYRDGTPIDTADTTGYSDTGLSEGSNYSYEVSAVNGAGLEGAKSAPQLGATQADLTPPELVSVQAPGSPDTVQVLFSERLDQACAEDAANYKIDYNTAVSAASLGADERTVTLETSALMEGIPYTLTVNHVRDCATAGNAIATDSQSAFVYCALDKDLVLWLRLDESSGTNAHDASGQGGDGTLAGAVWAPSGGRFDGAVSFDGVDDRVDLGSVDVAGTGLTLAVWMKADDFGITDARMISKATGTDAADHYWMLSTIGDGTGLRYRLKTSGATTTLATGNGEISAAQWHHVAATYDGSQMRIFRDAQEVATASKTGAMNTDPSVLAALGNQPLGAGAKPYDGLLDDVRIYSRALGTNELATLMRWGHERWWDTDRDGMPDDWEEDNFGSTSNALGSAVADWDKDGMCNLFELYAGTQPTNNASVLQVAGFSPSGTVGDGLVLQWSSVVGRMYRIQCATNLPGRFENVVTNIPACPPINCYTVQIDSATSHFCRVVVER